MIREQLRTLYWNAKEQGPGMAYNYAVFRTLFGIHSKPVAWALNRWHPYPPFVEIEITTYCDLKCVMCEHTHWKQPSRFMDFKDFVKILDNFPKLRWIDITGIGEGIMHPRFLDMVAEIKSRGIYLELYDAFHRWDAKVTSHMMRHGLNRIQPSIDGCSKDVYETIRVNANFDTVHANLEEMHRAKDRWARKLPEVSYHFIVQKSNQHEMGDYIRMVRDLAGTQEVDVQFTELLYEYPEIEGQKYDVPNAQREHVDEIARRHKVGVRWNHRMGRQTIDAKQCTMWGMPFIFVDGSVIRCCTSNEHNERDRQRANAMGNIFTESFRSMWDGESFRGLRKALGQGKMTPGCEDCPTFGECQ